MDARQQAIVDCARIAWQRMHDTFNARKLMEEGNIRCIEAFLILERIKDLAPELDWDALGFMLSDDPRRKKPGQ